MIRFHLGSYHDGIVGWAKEIIVKGEIWNEMTKIVEKEVDEYDWMLVSYGEDQFEKDKKKCHEEGERSGFVKGEVEKSESIAFKLMEDNYP